MRKPVLTAVAGGALIATLAGTATADVTLNLGNFDLTPGQIVTIDIPNLSGTLTGWDLSFDYLGNTDASWSSDALFGVQGANGVGIEAGGYDMTLGFESVGTVGQDNGNAGTFMSSFSGWASNVSGAGTWTMYVADGWSGGTQVSSYHNVVFTLFGVVPSPGAVALLGVAGLLGNRRRRRA